MKNSIINIFHSRILTHKNLIQLTFHTSPNIVCMHFNFNRVPDGLCLHKYEYVVRYQTNTRGTRTSPLNLVVHSVVTHSFQIFLLIWIELLTLTHFLSRLYVGCFSLLCFNGDSIKYCHTKIKKINKNRCHVWMFENKLLTTFSSFC